MCWRNNAGKRNAYVMQSMLRDVIKLALARQSPGEAIWR